METVDFVNASDFFGALGLGDAETQEFLDQFTYGDSLTTFTLISRGTFLSHLKNFILDSEDLFEKDALIETLRDYNLLVDVRIKYINIE